VADYYLVKRQHVVLEDLYTLSPDGSLYFDGGWNRKALIALAGSGFVSIGLSLLGAYAVVPNIGDWGWLIGSTLGAVLYMALMRRAAPSLSRPGRIAA
jgi:NCS1 family nucleobase:cation symporter-1